MELNLQRLNYTDIEIFDYGRSTSQMLITSGCGLGLGLMDILLSVSYWFDIDRYRDQKIDWEVFSVNLYFAGITRLILAGWFTVDAPKFLIKICRAFLGEKYFYQGGGLQTLREFISKIQ